MPARFLQPCRICGKASQASICIACEQKEQHFDKITHLHSAERLSAAKRLYDRRWAKARARYLAEHKYCANKKAHGVVVVLADEVDHIIPHRGDKKLFWDMSNWQPLCKACHSAKTATEDGGFGNLKKKRPQVEEKKAEELPSFF